MFRSLVGIDPSATAADVDQLRRRVGFYASVMLAVDLFAWVTDAVNPIIFDIDPPNYSGETLVYRFVATFIVLGTVLATRFLRPPGPVLVAMEAGVTLGLALVYVNVATGTLLVPGEMEFAPAFAMFGMILLLGVRAALVPSPVSRTVLIGAATMVLIFVFARENVDAVSNEIAEGLYFIAVAYVMASAFTSRVIYGLRREIREAMQLGQYTLEEPLGQGGMGTVYRARHALLRRRAAIKVIRQDGGRAPAAVRARFEREADATASLESLHTVGLYDFGVSAEGDFYTVMELLVGVDLETAVARFGPMGADRVVFLLRQACDSLAEAHAAGLVHRDVKPANLMICRYGGRVDVLKVLDFGLVALDPTEVGGTPATMAPEVVKGRADARSDLYGLGCVAYWLLTGRTVFPRDGVEAVLRAHAEDAPVPPSQLIETGVPPALEAVVMCCLEKDPARRPVSAKDLDERLATAVDDVAWTPARAQAWWDRHRPEIATSGVEADDVDHRLTIRLR